MKGTLKNNLESIEDVSCLKLRVRELEQLVTKLRKTEDELRESESQFRYISENIADIAFTLDMNFRTTYANPAIETILGFSPEERKSQRVEEQLTPESLQLIAETLAEELEREKFENVDPNRSLTLVFDFYHKDGSIKSLETSVRGVRDSKGNLKGFLGLSRDITERKRMEDALKKSEKRYRELSTVDNLTQLYNLRQFYAQLKVETDRSNRYGHPLTLLFLDLDDFKAFNDTYGHIEGDKVLQRIGRIIKDCLRETDFAYRYGGEEFTITLPMTTEAEGNITAERINAKIRTTPFSPPPDRDVYVTVSTGVAQYRPKECIRSFVNRADQLMYEGKKRGKNRVFYEGYHS